MSIYSNVTEQDLINLHKLAKQQKNQQALNIKNRILKQTHDIKLAESFSPITKKLDEVNETTKKLDEVFKENNTPQLAIENTQNALSIENEQILTGVIYDTSLEYTLSNMKKQKGFFKIEARANDDIFWNGFPVEKIGGNKINEKIFIISDDLQNVFTNTSNIPLKI